MGPRLVILRLCDIMGQLFFKSGKVGCVFVTLELISTFGCKVKLSEAEGGVCSQLLLCLRRKVKRCCFLGIILLALFAFLGNMRLVLVF